ncbi:Divergent polysaccharide deacetylase [compost metagenome]
MMIRDLRKLRVLRWLLSGLLLLAAGGWSDSVIVSADAPPNELKQPNAQSQKRLAVIIDDLGNQMKGTDEILAMPVKLTVAVMPFLPSSEQDARDAHERGHDVLIHLPLEPKQGNPKWLGPGAILSNMPDEEVRKKVEEAIDNIPFAVGINNHMGSKITGDKRIMSVILDVCRERGLFFVDSKTNYWSVAGDVSSEKGLPELHNDIFLDDVHTERHIAGQFHKIEKLLEQRGKCVTIGHVGVKGDKTAKVLKEMIPEFQLKGITFVGISEFARDQRKDFDFAPGSGIKLP